MMRYVTLTPAMNTPWNAAAHTAAALDDIEITSVHAAGEVKEYTVEKTKGDWAFLTPGEPMFAIISETLTGDPLDAYPIARGRITSMPDGFFDLTQTITISCAPQNLLVVTDRHLIPDGPVMAFAREHLAGMPETIPYLSDFDRDDPYSYLLGRPHTYHCDPLTHEISLDHIAVGDRIVNMSHAHFHDDQGVPSVTYSEPPVPRARLKIIAAWLQQGTVLCNIAPAIRIAIGADGNGYVLATHSPDFLEYAGSGFPSGMADAFKGTGWTLEEQNSRVKVSVGASLPIMSGRLWDMTYEEYIDGASTGQTQTIRHKEALRFVEYQHDFRTVWMRGEFAQEREETAWLVLEQPIQPVGAVHLDIDEGELSTIELTADLTAIPYEPGEWLEGERCQYGNRVFICKETHVSRFFYQQLPVDPALIGIPVPVQPGFQHNKSWSPHPYWEQVPSTAAVPVGGYDFFTTDLGKKVIAHGMLRLEKALLLRSRTATVTVTYPLEIAREITLKDSVRLEAPWPDGSYGVMVGKVLQIDEAWGGETPATITLTLGVSLGDGSNGVSGYDLSGRYTSSDYFADDYLVEQSDMHGYGSIEFAIDADPIPRPINVDFLKNSLFAVRNIDIKNRASAQRAAAQRAVWRDGNPIEEIQKHPTTMQIRMRDLQTEGPFKRAIYVAGTMLRSPRGIDMVGGGEP